MAGKGGGAWKVAYADFVTAMMAFFMVMWLTAQKPELKQAVAGYFRDPYAIFHGSDSGGAADGISSPDPMLGHAGRSQRRRVPNPGDDANYRFSVLFASGSAELDAVGREEIRSFAPTMVGKLNRIEVRAHCERTPLSDNSQEGWNLCYARAQAVYAELVAQHIDGRRLRLSLAESNEPMAIADEEMKLNSRVDVMLLPDLVDEPWRLSHGEEESTDEAEADVEAARPAHDEASAAEATPLHSAAEPSSVAAEPAHPAGEAAESEHPTDAEHAAEDAAEDHATAEHAADHAL